MAGSSFLTATVGDEVVSYGTGRLHDLAIAGDWRQLDAQLKGIEGPDAARMLLLYYLKYGPFRRFVSLTARVFRAVRRRLPSQRINPEPYALLAPHQRAALSADLCDDAVPAQKLAFENYEARDHFELVTDPGQVYALETLDAASSAAGRERTLSILGP